MIVRLNDVRLPRVRCGKCRAWSYLLKFGKRHYFIHKLDWTPSEAGSNRAIVKKYCSLTDKKGEQWEALSCLGGAAR